MLKIKIYSILFFLFCFGLQAELIISSDKGNQTTAKGVPLVVLSSTNRIQEKKGKIGYSNVLSILPQGYATLMQTIDNQSNYNLSKNDRKLKILNMGPLLLDEKTRAAFQRFFSESYHWSLDPKSYVNRQHIENEMVWIGELTLQYDNFRHHSYLSSGEKNLEELSEAGYEFLKLLHHVKQKLVKQHLNNQGLSISK